MGDHVAGLAFLVRRLVGPRRSGNGVDSGAEVVGGSAVTINCHTSHGCQCTWAVSMSVDCAGE